MKKEKIVRIVRGIFPEKYDQIVSLLRDTIKIETTENSNYDKDHSRFGGVPTLSKLIDWPVSYNGEPLSFFAQINLKELHFRKYGLPKTGMLYFFILTKNVTNRFPEKKGEFQVIYSPSITPINIEIDLTKTDVFIPTNILFSEDYSLPYNMDDCPKKNYFNYEEIELLEDMNQYNFLGLDEDQRIHHHMFGWPETLQYSVNVLFALKYFGLDLKVLEDDLFQEKMLDESKNFKVLLQIGFEDKNTNFNTFGGESIVYFGIHINDLKDQIFNKVVIVFQNT